MKSIPKTTQVQTLLFPRVAWDRRSSAAWARKHGFRGSNPDVTDDYIRYRQDNPDQFQPKSFRTITLAAGRKPIKAVIGRPWVIGGNPHCVLLELINSDWSLHKEKHAIYGQLAKQKVKLETGKWEDAARRKFKALANKAAKKYRAQHKIKPALKVVFPPNRIAKCVGELYLDFAKYWNSGQLDHFLPRDKWSKRRKK